MSFIKLAQLGTSEKENSRPVMESIISEAVITMYCGTKKLMWTEFSFVSRKSPKTYTESEPFLTWVTTKEWTPPGTRNFSPIFFSLTHSLKNSKNWCSFCSHSHSRSHFKGFKSSKYEKCFSYFDGSNSFIQLNFIISLKVRSICHFPEFDVNTPSNTFIIDLR